ncbi:TPA: hypothetical protein HA235_01505 [Candidatus Woesearchaeota archaeon]|nr:hypothetical protein [Candidatus Woesearchaeota archaeon]HIH31360.1 hypothetical protein [Candidatus Woesearchaeota archaeon]HIH54579.1 hypothetical protein [Candidatus Woesearchaeota archaeon]HIJ02367.1 hypothetical protein [Candidatus Woesearchaeota archaeon]HIJ14155.1 hypothetical protein [Candidatus Woesearchaeota archaeon]
MASNIIKKFVIGFGFLNGIWLAIGISPEEEIIKFLQPIFSNIHSVLKTLFIILPTLIMIITVLTLIKIYKKGGLIGSGAVVIAFLAGALIFKNIIASFVLLIIAYIIGLISLKK